MKASLLPSSPNLLDIVRLETLTASLSLGWRVQVLATDVLINSQNHLEARERDRTGGMPHLTSPKGIIFDLGDVLFTWSPNTTTTIPAKMMQSILSSATWIEYECGRIEQDACYR